VRVDYRITIPEFRRVFHFGRHAGNLFYHVLAYQRRVPGGPACDKDDTVDLAKLLHHEIEPVEPGAAVVHEQASPHGVANGVGLLKDLLKHKVRKPAFGKGLAV